MFPSFKILLQFSRVFITFGHVRRSEGGRKRWMDIYLLIQLFFEKEELGLFQLLSILHCLSIMIPVGSQFSQFSQRRVKNRNEGKDRKMTRQEGQEDME